MKNEEKRIKRINSILFLYRLEAGGEFSKDEIDPQVFSDINNLLEHNDEIESRLNNSLYNYTLSRLNLVDKAILKYSVYEMKYKGIPFEISINEALEITKIYSDIDGKQVAFNNKVLDKAKDLINGDK